MTKTTPAPFPNIICWNPESRQQTMNTEALRVRESIFHATHFPSPIHQLDPRTDPPTVTLYSEVQLAKAIQVQSVERVFCVVTGDSGTGKSHLIRWLWEEIEKENSTRWQIVRVPRHASNLADVLNYILKDFHGEVVERMRRELTYTTNLTRAGAAKRVLDELAFVLDPNNRERPSLRFPEDADHQEIILPLLPAMLGDNAIRRSLAPEGADTIVGRLADHVMGVRERRVDPARLRWEESDLAINVGAIDAAGEDARSLAATLLQDRYLRELTANVLNRAFEEAGPALVGLKRGNLKTAFLEIRRQLKAEGRELLLFIEDLSVSQGLDAELIESLLVTPAPDDGGIDLCVLRSVVGVTNEDFGQMLDNIRGRIDLAVSFDVPLAANHPDGFTDDSVADFTSRYLNAARYSLNELDAWLVDTKAHSELNSYCVESNCPNRVQCHAIFGAVNERGLYPFNRIAINRLYRNLHVSRHGGEERAFNPRLLVSSVIRQTLEEAEAQLPIRTFPATTFLDRFKLTEVAAEVQVQLRHSYGELDAARLRTLLEIYAVHPNTTRLPNGLPEVFALRNPTITRTTDTVERPPIEQPKPVRSAINSFDRWVNTGRLDDTDLNVWRSAVFRAMKGFRDWDSEPCGPWLQGGQLFRAGYIHFEGQHTARAGDVKLEIERSPERGEAIRYLVTGEGGRTGLRLAMHLIDECCEDVCSQIGRLSRTSGQPKPLGAAVHLLATGALISGKVPNDVTVEALLAAMLEEWPAELQPEQGRSSAWNQLRFLFSSQGRVLQEWFLRQVGSFKGGAVRAIMLDVALVLPEVERAVRRIDFDFPSDLETKWEQALYRPLLEIVRRAPATITSAIREETEFCRKFLEHIDKTRGEHSIRELGEQLKNTLQFGITASIFDNIAVANLIPRCEAFISGAVEEQVRLARAVTASDTPRNKQLRLIADLNRTTMADAVQTLEGVDRELRKAEAYVGRQLNGTRVDEIEELEIAIRNGLKSLREKLESMIEGGRSE